MGTIDEGHVTIQSIPGDWYRNKVAAVDMLRLDLIHPIVSGNKWFKLRLNMKHAVEGGFKAIVTFGGGYSNHLIATAFAAKMFGLPSVGIVRGRYDVPTPTLQACREHGMDLIYVSHEDYKNKDQPQWAKELVAHFDDLFIIPEGGDNEWGRAGAGLISRFINDTYTHISVSVGTGTTLAGLRTTVSQQQHIIGFAPMKQGNYLQTHIANHLPAGKNTNWQLHDTWHFGGFGKWTAELTTFMNEFYSTTGIPLDIVYTSKMMFGIRQMIGEHHFDSDARILCIHTGGLQGKFVGERCFELLTAG